MWNEFLMWFCNIIIRADTGFISETSAGGWLFCPKQTFFGKCHFFETFINQGWKWKEVFFMKWHSPGLQMGEVWVLVLHDHLLHDKAALIKNAKCLRAEKAGLILLTWGLISLEECSNFCSASVYSASQRMPNCVLLCTELARELLFHETAGKS